MKKFKMKFLIPCMSAVVFVCSIASAIAINSSAYINDPDGDGQITIYDAILVSNYLNGKTYVSNPISLDYDANGIISQMDVYKIGRAIVH